MFWGVDGVIIVADKNNADQLQKVEQVWQQAVDNIKENRQDFVQYAVVLTKEDLYSWDEANQNVKDAKSTAQAFAEEWGIPYYKLNSKTGQTDIDDLFKNIAWEIHWIKSQ